MTHEDSGMWLILALGIVIGWWWRGRAERQSRKDDLPQWMARLGHHVAAQFYDIDRTARFTGDACEVVNEQTYSGNGKRFIIQVRRPAEVTIDL